MSGQRLVRKELGQFFTPPSVARFMGQLATNATQPRRILDPGAGTGILAAAVCEALPPGAGPVHVDAFESDPLAADLCEQVLTHTTKWCETERGVSVTFEVSRTDFIARHAEQLRPSLYTKDDRVGYGEPGARKDDHGFPVDFSGELLACRERLDGGH
jgi:N-6 DNA Methylase